MPTYAARIKALSTPIKRLTYPEEVSESKTLSAGFTSRPPTKKVPAPDQTIEAFNRIQQLLAGSRIEKKGVLLKGGPESQVEGIMSFLEGHGFLKSTLSK